MEALAQIYSYWEGPLNAVFALVAILGLGFEVYNGVCHGFTVVGPYPLLKTKKLAFLDINQRLPILHRLGKLRPTFLSSFMGVVRDFLSRLDHSIIRVS